MGKYARKTDRGHIPPEVMERAADICNTTNRSLRSVAKEFGIDKMTLTRFAKRKRENNSAVYVGYGAITTSHRILPPQMEQDLADHIKQLCDMFHAMTISKCLQLAYELAVRNDIKVPDNWVEKKAAGEFWWYGFKSRHNLALRTPEATSLGRASAFNPRTTSTFFDILADVMDRYSFKASQIVNLDETGCTTVQKPAKVVSSKGKKQVGSVTSAERGQLVTLVYAVSAAGVTIPPMFIFPRVNFKDHFVQTGPNDSIGGANKSGWITEELFVTFLEHLINQTHCSNDNKILLIMDNHDTHISIAAIELARANGVVMLTIPPHCSHKFQPLDVSVFGPFKRAYNNAGDGWMRSNPGKTLSIYNITALVNQAQLVAFTPRNILSGFQSTGIYPFNRDIFSESDFTGSAPTDRALEAPASEDDEVERIPGTSTLLHVSDVQTDTQNELAADGPSASIDAGGYVSPSDIYKVPKAGPRKANGKRRRGKSMVLTDTPNKDEIFERKSKGSKGTTNIKKAKNPKKKLFTQTQKEDSASETDSVVPYDSSDDDDDDLQFQNEFIEDDFVVVKVAGKARIINYIAKN